MLIAQITDLHITLPGRRCYQRVDTAPFLAAAVEDLAALRPAPDVVLVTGDLVDLGLPEEYAALRRLLAPLRQPLYLIPGNHDERAALVAAFSDHAYLPREGFLHYAVEDWPLRLIGLDTLVPGQGGGALCAERLAWLERTLVGAPDRPTLLFMHHPPFATGLSAMDKIGLEGAEAFAAILRRHPQVQLVTAGHLHRPIVRRFGGTLAATCPSTAHQVTLDLTPDAPSSFALEPPGFQLHLWRDGALVSHTRPIGRYEGPYPFFEDDGKMIV